MTAIVARLAPTPISTFIPGLMPFLDSNVFCGIRNSRSSLTAIALQRIAFFSFPTRLDAAFFRSSGLSERTSHVPDQRVVVFALS